jgi:sulfate permease, SulP family
VEHLIRVDESLSFANAGYAERFVMTELPSHPYAKHLILIASAINYVDSSALEMLENLLAALRAGGITLHLSEVRGPVMDRLRKTHFLEKLAPGKVFLSAIDAVYELSRIEDAGEYAI